MVMKLMSAPVTPIGPMLYRNPSTVSSSLFSSGSLTASTQEPSSISITRSCGGACVAASLPSSAATARPTSCCHDSSPLHTVDGASSGRPSRGQSDDGGARPVMF